MQTTKSFTIHTSENPEINNMTFVVDLTNANEYPIGYQQLCNRDYRRLPDYAEYPIALRTKIAYFLVFVCKQKKYKTYSHLLKIPYNTYKKFGQLSVHSNPIHRINQHLITRDAVLANITGHQRTIKYHMLERALLLLIHSVNDLGLLENATQFKRHAIQIELSLRAKCQENNIDYPQEPFTCSQSFRDNFFKKNNLRYRNASGTSAGVTITRSEVLEFIRDQVPDYDSYTADRLLNLDESALIMKY